VTVQLRLEAGNSRRTTYIAAIAATLNFSILKYEILNNFKTHGLYQNLGDLSTAYIKSKDPETHE